MLNTITEISRPTRKPKPAKAFKAVVIFNIFTGTASGGIHELSIYLLYVAAG